MRATIRTPGRLDVAIVTMHFDEDPAVNRARMAEKVHEALEAHPSVRLVAFGELALGWFWHGERHGRPFDETVKESTEYHGGIAEPVPGPTSDALGQLARERSVYISFGLTERAGEKVHNSQALIAPNGEVIDVRRKERLASPMFDPGMEPARISMIDGVRVATLICSDAGSPEVRKTIRKLRADLVIHPLCDPWTRWVATAPNRLLAAYFRAPLAMPNRVGGEPEPESRYPGLTCIHDRLGRIRARQVGSQCILTTTVRAPTRGSWRHRVFGDLLCGFAVLLWFLPSQMSDLYHVVRKQVQKYRSRKRDST